MANIWQDRHTVMIKLPADNKAFKWKESTICFSLDGTLVKTKTGNAIPRNDKDWEFIYDNTVMKLREMNKYASIVIMSCEKNIGAGKISKHIYQKRVCSILDALEQGGVYPIVIISTKSNKFSKPYSGLWRVLKSLYDRCNASLNHALSIYVGAMGGHAASSITSVWGQLAKDKGHYDRAFAHNVGMRYKHPDVFFNVEMYNHKLNPKDFSLRPVRKLKITNRHYDDDNDANTDVDVNMDNETKTQNPIAILGPVVSMSGRDRITGGGLGSTITPSKKTAAATKSELANEHHQHQQRIPYRQWKYGDSVLTRDELDELVLTHTAEQTSLGSITSIIEKFKSARLMIILVGPPGSGKSTLASILREYILRRRKSLMETCFIVNPVELKSKRKAVKIAGDHIRGEASVIIDGYNSSSAERAEYIQLVHDENYAVVIIKMEISDRLAYHLNCFNVETSNEFDKDTIPLASYVTYNKKYQDPDMVECSDRDVDVEAAIIKYTPRLPSDNGAFWFIY